MHPCFRINTHIGASKLNKPLKLTILPQGVVCREVLKHNIFHVSDLSCQSPASFTVKLHHYSLRSWINRQAGRHKDRQACPAGDLLLHNSSWEGGVLWKANLDIISSVLNISFAAIRGADTLLSQLLFLCHLHDTARWMLKTKKMTRPIQGWRPCRWMCGVPGGNRTSWIQIDCYLSSEHLLKHTRACSGGWIPSPMFGLHYKCIRSVWSGTELLSYGDVMWWVQASTCHSLSGTALHPQLPPLSLISPFLLCQPLPLCVCSTYYNNP